MPWTHSAIAFAYHTDRRFLFLLSLCRDLMRGSGGHGHGILDSSSYGSIYNKSVTSSEDKGPKTSLGETVSSPISQHTISSRATVYQTEKETLMNMLSQLPIVDRLREIRHRLHPHHVWKLELDRSVTDVPRAASWDRSRLDEISSHPASYKKLVVIFLFFIYPPDPATAG